MKKIIFIVLLFCTAYPIVCAQKQISVSLQNRPVEELFRSIESQSFYRIYGIPAEFDSLRVSVKANQENVTDVLKRALAATSFQITEKDSFLFVFKNRELHVSYSPGIFIPDSGFQKEYNISDFQLDNSGMATSENRVYVIGDPLNPDKSGRVLLQGKVVDFKTGLPLVGTYIYIEDTPYSAVSDSSGIYRLKLPVGRQQLQLRAGGKKSTWRIVQAYHSGVLNIELADQVFELKEVTVSADKRSNVESTQMSMQRLTMTEIKNIPTALGEVDILRAVASLPGVKTNGEVASGFNVRGGATDQNLILFNEGVVYNPTHLFGLFSAFNGDIVNEVELYKSSIPIRYGGRLSSLLDVKSAEGNKERIKGGLGIGLVSSRLKLDGPIGKNTTFILGGRTTYSDWMTSLLPEKSGYKNGRASFYDMNLGVTHKFSPKSSLSVSGYYSQDRFSFTKYDRYGYRNANVSLKWRQIINERLVSTIVAGYDHYDYDIRETENPVNSYDLSFKISQYLGRVDFKHSLTSNNTLDYGVQMQMYQLNPGKYLPRGEESLVVPDYLQKEKAIESALYIGDKWDISPAFSVEGGVRLMMFNVFGPRTYNRYLPGYLPSEETVIETVQAEKGKLIKSYFAPEFRISGRYTIIPGFSVKAGFNTAMQNVHKLSNTLVMSPTDIWKLSDVNVKPQKGWQAVLGLYKDFADNTIETSVEVYYKKMENYLDYRNGALLVMNHNIETDVFGTRGKAYGIELMLKKKAGKLNGWVSYCYSRTLLQQNDKRILNPVNSGGWYPADYDKPHEVKFVGNYKMTHRFSLSMNCDYSTGRPLTIPVSKYHSQEIGADIVYYSDRNSSRIPDYFRMDVAFNVEPRHRLSLWIHSTFSLGIYNVTGRKNAYSVYYINEDGQLNGYKMSIFGAPIPFFTYNMKF